MRFFWMSALLSPVGSFLLLFYYWFHVHRFAASKPFRNFSHRSCPAPSAGTRSSNPPWGHGPPRNPCLDSTGRSQPVKWISAFPVDSRIFPLKPQNRGSLKRRRQKQNQIQNLKERTYRSKPRNSARRLELSCLLAPPRRAWPRSADLARST